MTSAPMVYCLLTMRLSVLAAKICSFDTQERWREIPPKTLYFLLSTVQHKGTEAAVEWSLFIQWEELSIMWRS